LRWAWLGLIGAYAATVVGTGLVLGRGAGGRLWWRLPAVFAILHTAYGTGFALGLIRFARGGTVASPTASSGRAA
jgi:hypothetical protein